MAKKKKINVVYSTNPDFAYSTNNGDEQETLAPAEQNLKVWIDKKQRGGKVVSLIQGFIGSNDDLKSLAGELKSLCGVGGSAKDGEILIQGDHRDRIEARLTALGHRVKRRLVAAALTYALTFALT